MYRASVFAIVLGTLVGGWPGFCWPASGTETVLAVETLEERHGALLRSVASEEHALSAFAVMFREMTRDLQGRPRGRLRQSLPTPVFPADVRPLIVGLTANLATAAWARTFREAIERRDPAAMTAILGEHTAQYRWLRSASPETDLAPLLSLMPPLSRFGASTGQDFPIPPRYERFVRAVNDLHPELNGALEAWLAVLDEEGADGVHLRLTRAWERVKDELESGVSSEEAASDADRYVLPYIRTRLLPVLTARVLAQTILVQAQAEHAARQAWTELLAWRARQREARALARLCGTWRWIVHNHQNHQDHTMTLSFFPPGQARSGQPRPATILIHGDTVYLRWEFPSGFQEDSLLLSNQDRRLEGTFVNSRGPYGSISGKRLSSCSR